ncbi:MAG: glycine betaine ABC transporter substrate-binding protein, partial [Candidatus Thermoplasmatota archaeon]|nr:glycine betaine ABC transporter substrate-binding protein [Candidatus Thermoplasmatota archaeon]
EKTGVVLEGGAKLGLVVPKYTVDELDISSISDLEASAGVFDGEIIGIEAGAGIMEMAEKAIKDYNLGSFKLMASSEAGMLSALDAALDKHEHIVVTLWDPHWATGAYDIVYLKDPNHSFGEAESIESWARPGLKAEDAVLAGLMERYTYEVSEFNGLLAYIEDSTSDTGVATREWLDSNTETRDIWIGDATHQENRGEIDIGLVNWACAVGSSNVLKHLLEDLGYTVNLKVVDAGVMYTGLANGDIDLITTAWVPLTHKHYMEMYA